MGYREVSFEKRIKENIKNYAIKNLYAMDMLAEYLQVARSTVDYAYGQNCF